MILFIPGITPQRVVIDWNHLRCLALVNTALKKTSQRWRVASDAVSDLSSSEIEP